MAANSGSKRVEQGRPLASCAASGRSAALRRQDGRNKGVQGRRPPVLPERLEPGRGAGRIAQPLLKNRACARGGKGVGQVQPAGFSFVDRRG